MKTNTKIWLLIFIASLVGVVLTTTYLMSAINVEGGRIVFNMTTLSWVALVISLINTVSMNVLYVKFLKTQKFNSMLFFSTVPLTLSFGAIMFLLASINTIGEDNKTVRIVKTALQISNANNNNYYWIAVAGVVWIVALFIVFTVATKPIKKVQKATVRLSYGDVKNNITIGGGKDFKEIEYSLNKINDNYKQKDSLIQKTSVECDKLVPKQILKFFGKKSALDLEIGSKVQKEVTTLFCDIRNSSSVGSTLSLEENFNYINSYLNIVSPIIKKYNGFIDKYLGDGILAVFIDPVQAINCSHAIIKKIKQKNMENPTMPNLDVGVAMTTGDVIFGVVGDDGRKSVTIISSGIDQVTKMAQINTEYGSMVLVSKNTLTALPNDAEFYYRYIASITIEDSKEMVSVFESLEVYPRQKREKLIKHRMAFEEAVRAFYNGKYDIAKQQFEKVYRLEKDDKACYVYFNKASEFLGEGPLRA